MLMCAEKIDGVTVNFYGLLPTHGLRYSMDDCVASWHNQDTSDCVIPLNHAIHLFNEFKQCTNFEGQVKFSGLIPWA